MIQEAFLRKMIPAPPDKDELDEISATITAKGGLQMCNVVPCTTPGSMRIDSMHYKVDTDAVVVTMDTAEMPEDALKAFKAIQKSWFCVYHMFWIIGTLHNANPNMLCSISATDPEFFLTRQPKGN